MAADTDVAAVVSAAKALADVTEAAWNYAAVRDFVKLAQAIERRDHLIKTLQSKGDLAALPVGCRAEVLRALERAQKIDADIRGVLENEMAEDNEAISDAATKAKVLSAYERIVPRARRFDTQK